MRPVKTIVHIRPIDLIQALGMDIPETHVISELYAKVVTVDANDPRDGMLRVEIGWVVREKRKVASFLEKQLEKSLREENIAKAKLVRTAAKHFQKAKVKVNGLAGDLISNVDEDEAHQHMLNGKTGKITCLTGQCEPEKEPA